METGQTADRRRDFETLVVAVADPVRRYLRRRTDQATADDVLAETLIVLWRRFDDVPEAAVAWAIGIARLQLANALRAQRRQNRVARRIVETATPPQPDDGTAEAVRTSLARLRPADAEIIRLWAWEGLEPAQIATVLAISANAAAVRLHRARRRFADQFGKDAADSGQIAVDERTTS
ncbi:RNA polymerase sigma factor [uncultured Microbacterium sp.]|uniref:Sigma-70, region 4 type 2 n=1 Tax=uncultured Microbacterium sp. TaxID=191216 RepID=A0A1Y5P3I4_9MICO|nr:sigma-70 family RNA polymerase sigma factor [uncultured Microbacterium sp.]SBS73254.1 Sigma-70, region 4 type 2 [uncultured Microbacterium sp.]